MWVSMFQTSFKVNVVVGSMFDAEPRSLQMLCCLLKYLACAIFQSKVKQLVSKSIFSGLFCTGFSYETKKVVFAEKPTTGGLTSMLLRAFFTISLSFLPFFIMPRQPLYSFGAMSLFLMPLSSIQFSTGANDSKTSFFY